MYKSFAMELTKRMIAPDAAQLPDAEVAERVLGGEKELYELLMRRHNQKLYRAVRSYLKEEQEVEDAMQDTYLKAYEKLHQFRHSASFSTWLIRIGINTALEKLRKAKRASPLNLSADDQENHAVLLSQVNFMDPENLAIRQEVKLLLEKAIDDMPEMYSAVYVLREVEGMDINEVVQCLDLSESNVKVRLHRAKAMLKESLYRLSISRDAFAFGFRRCDALVKRVMQALL